MDKLRAQKLIVLEIAEKIRPILMLYGPPAEVIGACLLIAVAEARRVRTKAQFTAGIVKIIDLYWGSEAS